MFFRMKANPGGQIDLKTVVGRGRLIRLLWDTVEQQSAVITAERRIGKTTVIKKMMAEPAPGWTPVFQDLERYHSASEFATAVYREVDHFLGTRGKVARRAMESIKALGGVEVGGVLKLPERTDAPWKDVLARSIEESYARERRHGWEAAVPVG